MPNKKLNTFFVGKNILENNSSGKKENILRENKVSNYLLLGLLTFLWKQETLFGFGKFTFAVGT
jgi:hypothetical protein